MSREEVLRDYEEYKSKNRIWGQVPVDRISKIKFPRPAPSIIARYCSVAHQAFAARQADCRHGSDVALHAREKDADPRGDRQRTDQDVNS
jgi:hypothetical protein